MTALRGREEIEKAAGRSWPIVLRLIKNHGFPATRLGGIWESDTELIAEWKRKYIVKNLSTVKFIQKTVKKQ